MKASQLQYIISNACKNPAILAEPKIKDALLKYQKCHCYHPRTINVSVSDFGSEMQIQVPCGKCVYCADRKREEWFTRLWLETRDRYQYTYLVSLHYRGYETYDEIPKVLRNAFFHYDNQNYTHHLCYHPCLCRIEHMQMFFRHLRHDTRDRKPDIRTFYCMEYGKKYGRPHSHVILWSQVPLTKDDIAKAWSVRIGRKHPIYCPIGNFDFQDLQTNGTIVSTPIMIDGKKRSAKYCFKYVAKYVCKQDEANYNRVELLRQYIKSTNYKKSIFDDVFEDYEKFVRKLYSPESFSALVECHTLEEMCNEAVVDCAFSDRLSFYKLFKCFTSCSRSEGIGCFYARANMQRFLEGQQRIPDRTYKQLIFPSYFLRKVKEFINPIQRKSRLKGSSSYSAQNRPLQYEHLSQLASYVYSDSTYKDYVCNFDPFSQNDKCLNFALNSSYSFRNCVTGERFLIHLTDDASFAVSSWIWSKKFRKYLYYQTKSIVDFVSEFLDKFQNSYEYSQKVYLLSDYENACLCSAFKLCDDSLSGLKWYKSSLDDDIDGFKNYKCVTPHDVILAESVVRLERDNKFFGDITYENFNAKIE